MNNESMTRLETFVNLGFKKDPFKGVAFETGDGLRVRKILTMAVASRAMVSIVGERGLGKTEAVKAALKEIGCKIVKVERTDVEKTTIADIRKALILDLSDQTPKRDGEISSRQLRPVVGMAAENYKKHGVVLVIEEAHRLHGNTLRSLKSLREADWMGESELFTIVLVGQSDPMTRPGVSEVRLRTDCVNMKGLSGDEAASYLRKVLGTWFDETALAVIPELPQSRNWLELQEASVLLLNRALSSGREAVTGEDVRALIGALQQSLRVPGGKQKAATPVISGNAALASVLAGKTAGPVALPTAIGER